VSGLLRDDEKAFVSAIENAQDVVEYSPAIILKDYWVCEVLRALLHAFPATFLFKGGTSLAKGWNLIDRMSEDVDILVSDLEGESTRDRPARLGRMTRTVADALDLRFHEHRKPGQGRNAHRADRLEYPTLGFGAGGVGSAGVLLETGFGQGWEPLRLIRVVPLLANAAGSSEYRDLQPLEVQALLPVRTLIEKLHALHSAVGGLGTGTDLVDASRLGRHYYDIYCCLGHADTLKHLADRPRMEILFRDVERISAERYGSAATRPEEGYGASPAFKPGVKNERRERLERAYGEAEGLMRTTGKWPTFGAVLKRAQDRSDLL
jgi:Nucleotidyl transferase AbiEii toxin, Type IV TA system